MRKISKLFTKMEISYPPNLYMLKNGGKYLYQRR